MTTSLHRKSPVFRKWRELKEMQIPEPEYIITGLIKGEIGMIQAITNIGKTTLALNMCICLATGRPFEPIVKEGPPRRILYLDYETQISASKADLARMSSILSADEQGLLEENFILFNARDPEGGDLKLTTDQNLRLLAETIKSEAIDLVIIDPMSLAFAGIDEQDNTAIAEKIIDPLSNLSAVCGGVSIIVTHHIGKEKSEEGAGGSRIGAYRSRGASNFGALNRALIQLDTRIVDGRPFVRVSYEKIKGEEPDPVLMSIDPELRWFQIVQESTPQREETTVEKLVQLIEEFGGKAKRGELLLKGRFSTGTLDRCLKAGVRDGLLEKGEHGTYHVIKLVEGNSAEKSTKSTA